MDGGQEDGAGGPRRWDHVKELALQWGAKGHFEQGRDVPKLFSFFFFSI